MRTITILAVCLFGLYAGEPYTNALIGETSPYLVQHAHNPVHWYPWGKDAFEKAKREGKLIFLSIGYSTCHWCHEMEKESFTDEEVARLLNADFVSIKVDKEEYPQIDKKYQALYHRIYGERGGWPLSVFLSPEGKVFYITTYIPKDEGYGSKGLLKMLPEFVALYKDPKVFAKRIVHYAADAQTKHLHTGDISTERLMTQVVQEISKAFDRLHGGFSVRPKFPESAKIQMLLTIYRLTGNIEAKRMAVKTLDEMARSGLYDQVEGGFFRYTTDAAWQQPHFEKMLYTNAELIETYAKAYVLFRTPHYRQVVKESIAHMMRYFSQEGLFFAASDADSKEEEGGYYLFDYTQIKEILEERGWKEEMIDANLAYFGIEEDGNIDGELSNTHLVGEVPPPRAKAFRAYLGHLRETRTFPFVDRKIITSWNAMMIKTLFVAGEFDARYMVQAQKSLEHLLGILYLEGRLYHQTLYGKRPKQQAILEDYAFLVAALLEGYDHTCRSAYLSMARSLADEAIKRFEEAGVWYLDDTPVHTVADFDDRYYTSPLSVMLEDLVKLAALTEDRSYLTYVKRTFEKMGGVFGNNPSSSPKLVSVYLRWQKGDVVIHAKAGALRAARPRIAQERYPFLLSKAQENAGYLACGISVCFATDKNITRLLNKIEKIKFTTQGAAKWRK